jgi:hypothetical protein
MARVPARTSSTAFVERFTDRIHAASSPKDTVPPTGKADSLNLARAVNSNLQSQAHRDPSLGHGRQEDPLEFPAGVYTAQ